jgi:hypothetical protein
VIDSQSVKTTESGGIRGFDAGKRIKGRKRHITDTNGFLVGVVVHSANIQDRDSAAGVLTSVRHSFPWLRHVFADGDYAGDKLMLALGFARPLETRNRPALRSGRGLCPFGHADGSSSEPSPGPAATVAWQRTSTKPSKAPFRGFLWPPSNALSAGSQTPDIYQHDFESGSKRAGSIRRSGMRPFSTAAPAVAGGWGMTSKSPENPIRSRFR